jgi:hypothetical protein
VFFSLVTALDEISNHKTKKIENGIIEVNNRFNSDLPLVDKEPDDVEFIKACSASTSTKENRTIRHTYIKKWIE